MIILFSLGLVALVLCIVGLWLSYRAYHSRNLIIKSGREVTWISSGEKRRRKRYPL